MKKVYLLLAAFCAISLNVNAKSAAAAAGADDEAGWVCQANIGYAWSRKAGVANPDKDVFTNVASTDTNDAKVNNSSFVGLSLSRNLWSWLSAGVSYDMYNGFEYAMYHKGATALTGTAVEVSTGTEFARSFDLGHQSALFNVNLMLPEDWEIEVAGMHISPVLGGGVGVGISTVSNFRAVDGTGNMITVALPNRKASLAYQGNGGLMFQPEDGNVRFGVNYRYYHGGKFESAKDYMFNGAASATANGTAVSSKAWAGKLKTHQVRLCLDFEF